MYAFTGNSKSEPEQIHAIDLTIVARINLGWNFITRVDFNKRNRAERLIFIR